MEHRLPRSSNSRSEPNQSCVTEPEAIHFSIENEIPNENEIILDNMRGEKIADASFGTQN
jgi:hypothetical protein